MAAKFYFALLSLFAVSIFSTPIAFSADPPPTSSTPLATPVPAPMAIDWDHLPEGDFKDLLTDKSGLDEATAARFTRQLRDVSARTHVPGFIILAATMQESDFRPYGVLYDYGNYSCSLAQYNISAWCETFSKSAKDRARVRWPKRVTCDQVSDLNQQIMQPFIDAIVAKHPMPEHGTTIEDFTSLDEILMTAQMPARSRSLRKALYQAGLSFGTHCNTDDDALRVMASSLKLIYQDLIPAELKKYHPSMAWLLADGAYNMGESAVRLIQLYGGPDIFKRLNPQLYVDVLTGLLKAKPAGQETLNIKLQDGTPVELTYFQICVSQRHMTSITNDGLPTDAPPAVKSFTENCETDFPPKNN